MGMGIAVVEIKVLRPFEFDPPSDEFLLKLPSQVAVGIHPLRSAFMLQAEVDERTGGFADIPFHRMKPIATIRQVGCTDVLRRPQVSMCIYPR